MKEIPLSKGTVALVDDGDFDILSKFKWYHHSSNRGYARGKIDGKWTYMHRFITDAPAGSNVDHINRNTLDNRRLNLRICDQIVNGLNSTQSDRGGVGKYKKWWRAYITYKGKQIHLGNFPTEDFAKVARKAALQVMRIVTL
jgi:hypothetical protein